MKRLVFSLAALLLVACGSDPYRRMYESIKIRNDAKKTPHERAASPTPSYDAYKKELERQKAE